MPQPVSGQTIRALRKEKNILQKHLAKVIGVKPHHICEMEYGQRTIGETMAKRLGKALNVDWNLFR